MIAAKALVKSLIIVIDTIQVIYAGLHLGNDSRGGKIMFYESEGGDGI